MLNSRSVSIALAAAAALVGVFFFLHAEEQVGGNIQITVASPAVNPPGFVTGVAGIDPEDMVEVTAEIDGVEISGSPDVRMEGAVNEFSFPVTEEMSGKDVIITATAPDGTQIRTKVHVN